MTSFTLFETPIGVCAIAWRVDAVAATALPAGNVTDTAAAIAARANARQGEPPPAIRAAIASITALLDGARTDLRFITCDFTGIEPFARQVYAATRAIPAGATRTYGEVAEVLGDKRAAQGVGAALGRNPFPIIVPCHRVIGVGGKLTGFTAPGGVNTKLAMLAIEGAAIGPAPTLFDDLPMALKPGLANPTDG